MNSGCAPWDVTAPGVFALQRLQFGIHVHVLFSPYMQRRKHLVL
jgi:hypothetical protein